MADNGAFGYVFNRPPTVADFPRANFDWLAGLPNDFWQGQQYARERQLQGMFRPGTSGADALARGDYAGALQQIAGVGGAQAVGPYLPTLMRLKFGQQLLDSGPANPAGGGPAPQAPPQPSGAYGSAPFAASSSKNGTGPANLSGNPAIGSDDQGETTVRSLFPGDNGVPQEIMDNVATAVGARAASGMSAADMPLTPQQAQRAQQIIQGRGGKPPASSPNTPSGRDVVAQGPSTTAGGYLSIDTEQGSQNRRRAAAGARQRALAASAAGLDDMAKSFNATADQLDKQADEIDSRIAKKREQEYGVGIKRAEEQGKSDVTQYAGLHKGLAGAGLTAAQSMPYVEIAKGLIEHPDFYSGSAEGINLAWKRALAGLGLNPNAPLPQEAFRKVMAANIMQQVNNLKAEQESMGQQGGRIFASQIELMEKAAQNPDNSVAANRYLTELAYRSSQRTMAIADMADDYKTRHGALDAGFEKQLRNWMSKHPMFSKEELANPTLIGGKPAAQKPISQEAHSRLKSGERYLAPDGKWRVKQ